MNYIKLNNHKLFDRCFNYDSKLCHFQTFDCSLILYWHLLFLQIATHFDYSSFMSTENCSTFLRFDKLIIFIIISFVINMRIIIIIINKLHVIRTNIKDSEYFLKIIKNENVDVNIYLSLKILIDFFTIWFFLFDDVNDSKLNIIFLKFKNITSRTNDKKNIF